MLERENFQSNPRAKFETVKQFQCNIVNIQVVGPRPIFL